MWSNVQGIARSHGLGISPSCEGLLRGAVADAVTAVANDPHRRQEVEENLTRLIEEMVKHAKNRGYGELHEDTFVAAMQRLCPLFPFC